MLSNEKDKLSLDGNSNKFEGMEYLTKKQKRKL